MELISVNIGEPRPIRRGKSDRMTGIFKRPASGPVEVTALGLAGDHIMDASVHGGPDQAVYAFTSPDYAWWSAHLGRELPPGIFGENLTIGGLESTSLRVGDRLAVGAAVVIEVTAPRVPCATLAARMEDPAFVKKFRAAERPGVYCRVIAPGAVQAGDRVTVTPHAGDTVSVIEFFRLFYERELGAADLRRLLAAPIPIRMRERYTELLAAAGDA